MKIGKLHFEKSFKLLAKVDRNRWKSCKTFLKKFVIKRLKQKCLLSRRKKVRLWFWVTGFHWGLPCVVLRVFVALSCLGLPCLALCLACVLLVSCFPCVVLPCVLLVSCFPCVVLPCLALPCLVFCCLGLLAFACFPCLVLPSLVLCCLVAAIHSCGRVGGGLLAAMLRTVYDGLQQSTKRRVLAVVKHEKMLCFFVRNDYLLAAPQKNQKCRFLAVVKHEKMLCFLVSRDYLENLQFSTVDGLRK